MVIYPSRKKLRSFSTTRRLQTSFRADAACGSCWSHGSVRSQARAPQKVKDRESRAFDRSRVESKLFASFHNVSVMQVSFSSLSKRFDIVHLIQFVRSLRSPVTNGRRESPGELRDEEEMRSSLELSSRGKSRASMSIGFPRQEPSLRSALSLYFSLFFHGRFRMRSNECFLK